MFTFIRSSIKMLTLVVVLLSFYLTIGYASPFSPKAMMHSTVAGENSQQGAHKHHKGLGYIYTTPWRLFGPG